MKAMNLIFAAFALVGATAQAASNQEIITHASYNVILATYSDLAQQTANLKDAVDTLAASPTEENLTAAQNAWRAARIPSGKF